MEFKRTLASVQEIASLTPIEGKDRIVSCTLKDLGWSFIVQKDKHYVGERVIYFEVDSLLPDDKEEFFFMQKQYRFRVKTIRLGGVISQGLVMKFSELKSYKLNPDRFEIGDDLTDIIGVRHYQKVAEQPVKDPKPKKRSVKGYIYQYLIRLIEFLIGPIDALGPWPGFSPRSDEPQLQHLSGIIAKKYMNFPSYISLKMHGKSSTAFYHNGRTGICSRNYELLSSSTRNVPKWKKDVANWLAKKAGIKIVSQDQQDFWVYARENKILEKLADYCECMNTNVAMIYELCGPKINGNMYNFDTYRGFVFDVWDIDKKRYYDYEELLTFCYMMEVELVPIIDDEHALTNDVSYYHNIFKGRPTVFGSRIEEGCVVRANPLIVDPHCGRISFKIVLPEFKMIEDETLGIE